ncbi:MAG TPA: hypothetical protein VHB27_01525 [Rhodopila sp.]|uniref:hypothetical protein n=1 Tax=Rhodopila sp. TaxID=2480087 RepID=UPI002B543692|nr:hypothetical protein [Rhodopila sp.]HVY13878.1 hypothetical protein [Rhodopila sp.]
MEVRWSGPRLRIRRICVLGTVRMLAVAPRIGETPAVLPEAPAMLGFSWIASAWSMRRFKVQEAAGSRIFEGLAAFFLLILAGPCLSPTVIG